MNELFLCTPGSIGSIVCLRQSPTMGALPPTPRSFPHWANGLFAKSVAARGKPCRNTEVSAPLATSTAPVALRQSRILRTMPDSYLKSPQHQSLRAQSCRNPVLLRLRCLVLNRLCLVLLRPRHFLSVSLTQNLFHHGAKDVGEPIIATGVAVGQFLMIKSHQMENCRM